MNLFAGLSRKYNINNVVPASTVFALFCTVASIISPEPASAGGFVISGEGAFKPSNGELFVAPKGGKVKVPVSLIFSFTVTRKPASVGKDYTVVITQSDGLPFKVSHAGVEFFGQIDPLNINTTNFIEDKMFDIPIILTPAVFPDLAKGKYSTRAISIPRFRANFKEAVVKDPAKIIIPLEIDAQPTNWEVIEMPIAGVPGPLPLLGAMAAFSYSRKLRRKLKSKVVDASSQKP